MTTFIKIDGVTYYEGSVIRSCGDVWDREICRRDKLLRVMLLSWQKNGECSLGVYSPEMYDHWHDCDGLTPNHQGFWLNEKSMRNCFCLEKLRMEIVKHVDHRGKELLGRKGTYLCPLDDTADNLPLQRIHTPKSIFVEMDDDVGGSGCDGLGTKGHCILVPCEAVKFEKLKDATDLKLQWADALGIKTAG